MTEPSSDLEFLFDEVATSAIQHYARGILSVSTLAAQMRKEWERTGQEVPTKSVLVRLAQRICSRALYEAWHSANMDLRNRAFDNLRNFLAASLNCIAKSLIEQGSADDVLHQTLLDLHLMLVRGSFSELKDTASFLKWTQTILVRHVYAYQQKNKSGEAISLDDRTEILHLHLPKTNNDNPERYIHERELHDCLKNAILSLSKQRYQLVLWYTYFVDMEDEEIARCMQAQIKDVYLWRHRALKALRSKPELMELLRKFLN